MTRSPLRISFVVDELGYGGSQKQLALLAPALAGHARVAVYCLSDVTTPFADVLTAAGVPVHVFPRRGSFDVTRLRRLVRAVRAEPPDVIHALQRASNVYAFIASRRAGCPVVVSLRTDRLWWLGPRGLILRAVMRRADAAVVNARAARTVLVDGAGLDPARVTLVPNLVPPSEAPREAPPGPVVGFLGRLVDYKRVDRLIDAFAHVRKEVPRAELVVVGQGPERGALEGRARSLGVADAVRFTGAVPDVRPLLRQFACLALPSDVEAVPNAVLEALAEGVPVVASPAGDLPDLVLAGRTGRLVREPTAEALAEAVVDVLGDDALREAAASHGPALVRERFSTEAAVATLLGLYERLAARRAAVPASP